MQNPRTIHDFGGFPQELFEVVYPAPGSREIAERVQTVVSIPQIDGNDAGDPDEWGLDHGTWSVLKHLYPEADVPVVQLSLAMDEDSRYHFELGAKLRPLRDEGILILGSGNIVHNLRQIDWNESAPVPAWASEFDAWVAGRIEARDFESLIEEARAREAGRLSIPTWDHWYPLLYVLGAARPEERLDWVTEGFQNATISMRSLVLGQSSGFKGLD